MLLGDGPSRGDGASFLMIVVAAKDDDEALLVGLVAPVTMMKGLWLNEEARFSDSTVNGFSRIESLDFFAISESESTWSLQVC